MHGNSQPVAGCGITSYRSMHAQPTAPCAAAVPPPPSFQGCEVPARAAPDSLAPGPTASATQAWR
eukprot:365168-Chlamydomonas_euryale.AAC.9